jgi:hypothetical protein
MRAFGRRAGLPMNRANAYGVLSFRVAWHAIRLPALLFLAILEPVVEFVFGALALLGVLITLFFKALGVPHFPFWTMLALSLGFGFVVVAYQGLIRLLEA